MRRVRYVPAEACLGRWIELAPQTAKAYHWRGWVREHLETYRKTHEATILLASHNMFEVERLCDRVIILKRGRIEEDDSPDGIMARYSRANLEEVFLDVARGRVQETAS